MSFFLVSNLNFFLKILFIYETHAHTHTHTHTQRQRHRQREKQAPHRELDVGCLLYTSDAADDAISV